MNGGYDMVNIIFVCVFDAKAIDNKGEGDVLVFVMEEARCIGFEVSEFE